MDDAPSTLGYNCNGLNRSCQSFLIYRTQPYYNTISLIASLLSANASQISAINNNTSGNMTLETNHEVIVPVMCSCTGMFYQANTTHVVQATVNYYLIGNDIFQGLTTCNAIRDQKSVINLTINESLTIPLRCACPSWIQVDDGILYLMTVVVQEDNSTIADIANKYGADVRQTLIANGLSPQASDTQPSTTLLIPLKNLTYFSKTNYIKNDKKSSQVVATGVPIIIAILLLIVGACFCLYRHKGTKGSPGSLASF